VVGVIAPHSDMADTLPRGCTVNYQVILAKHGSVQRIDARLGSSVR